MTDGEGRTGGFSIRHSSSAIRHPRSIVRQPPPSPRLPAPRGAGPMTQESAQQLNVRYDRGVTIVSFATPYLQAEDAIEKVGAQLFELAGDQGPTKILLS